ARQLAGRALRGWTGAPGRAATPAAPPAAKPTEILLVHRPGSQQSNILVGNLAHRPGDPIYYSATLANRILGGGVDARLFLILREQKGWTYGSYSRIVRRQDRGYFQANAEVRTPVTDSALVELRHQLRRIRTEAVADSELVAAKGYLIGSFPRQIETPQQIAGQVTTVKLLGLGERYLRTFRERLAALRPADLTRGARRTIQPDSSVIVVVGDGQQIYEPLRAIAPVRIVDVEGAPLTPADLAPRAAQLDLDPAQLASRSDSFRILVRGNPMGGQVGTITRSPDSIVYVERAAIGGFVEQQSVVVLDARTYAMRRADQTGRAGPQSMETHLTYANGRVQGRATIPQPSGTPKTIEVDTAIVEGTIDDNAVALVVPALPLAPGKTFRLMVFSSGEGALKPLTVRVGAAESITVPAGTFAALKVELEGMQVPMALYVSDDTPRRVVKIEGGPFVYELVKSASGTPPTGETSP
ncbi:MAG: insulinase family protein, partial [Gemmatimonadales bacterium]